MITFRQPFYNEWPITQKYGDTITSAFHTGIDYGCPLGTMILASADGLVVYAGMDKTGYGRMVIVQHNNNCSTLYAHLSEIFVHVNQNLKQSNIIGLSGNTGNSTGPHLHFQARHLWNDFRTHFDPMELPLTSVDDKILQNDPVNTGLKKGGVKIVCSAGAWGHNKEFTNKQLFYFGSEFDFTGEMIERNGLIFCECTPKPVWIAMDDGETQILENT